MFMKKIKEKWNRTSKKEVVLLGIKCIFLGLLPLLVCLVTCASQGYSLGQVSLPVSEWNDELFYYKQVESILSHGYPQGYFGFNESHALKYSFAAWSPVLVWPWLVYGFLFGWNLLSPIICNILILCLSMVGFTLLVRPTVKQCGILTLLFCTFTPFARYMLCGMPEVICFCMVILYFALLHKELEEPSVGRLVLLFIMSVVMTWMRPYLILFLLMPSFLWFRRKKLTAVLGSVGIFGITGLVYFLINHYLGAEYFTPLFKTEWVEPFLQGHIFSGIKGILVRIYYEGKNFFAITKQGMISGLAEGAFFAGYLLVMGILLYQTLAQLGLVLKEKRKECFDREKGWNKVLLFGYLLFCFFAMWMALLLMYKMKEGSKHLLTFMVMGIFSISLMETKFYKKSMVLAALFVYLFWMKGNQPYDYQVPFENPERNAQMAYWEQVFGEKLSLNPEEVPNYDNVVIWTFKDGDVLTDWQVLYALPKGFGISCCYSDYVREHLGELKSKYLLIPSGGELQRMCEEAGMECIGNDGRTVMYHTRNAYQNLKDTFDKEVEEVLAGQYEAIYLSMDSTENVTLEIFTTYRGLDTYMFQAAVSSAAKLDYVTDNLFSSALSVTKLYLEFNPCLYSGKSVEELLGRIRQYNPGLSIEVILSAPSLEGWKQVGEEFLSEEVQQELMERRLGEEAGLSMGCSLLEGLYEKAMEDFLADKEVILYFPGNLEWLISNRSHYENLGVDNVVFTPEVTKNLLISMICDGKYRIHDIDGTKQKLLACLQGDTSGEYLEKHSNLFSRETGKQWIFLGDSLFGNYLDTTSITSVIQEYSGIETINCGFGGLTMARDENTSFSAEDVIASLVEGEYGEFAHVPAYQGVIRAHQSNNPVFFISYGINDYIGEHVLEDPENPKAENTYLGALRSGIDRLQAFAPGAEIILLTPTYIHTFDEGTEPRGGYVLTDYVQGVKKVGKEYGLMVLDLYEGLPFSKEPEQYLSDGVHPNEYGRYVMGQWILEEVCARHSKEN